MARMNDFQCWAEQLKKREPWYPAVMRAMPSFKTSSFDLYFQRLPFFWMHLRFLLSFSADQGFLRWRFPIDEFRSSVTCSSCHKRLKKARFFTMMQREDEVDIRTKEQPSKMEVKEIAEMRKFRNPKLASMKIALQFTRNVLRCTNSRCKATFWNRDFNAARIMLELLRSELKEKLGTSRLRAFRRDNH
jgi:hypothetical protein